LNYFAFRFNSFGDSALKLNIYAWPQMTPSGGFVPYAEFARIKEEVLLSVAAIARRHGCELLQPLSYIHLRAADGPELSAAATRSGTGDRSIAHGTAGSGKEDPGM